MDASKIRIGPGPGLGGPSGGEPSTTIAEKARFITNTPPPWTDTEQPLEIHIPVLVGNDIPRRSRMDLWHDAERAIHDAVQAVERAGAHPLLTDAVVLLGLAKEKVADFVETKKVE